MAEQAAYAAGFGTAAPQPGADGGAPAPAQPVRRARRTEGHLGVDLALRTLVVPDHSSSFWDDVAQRLADEPQLRLRPRAAVRPITQPPPIIDDRVPLDDRDVAGGRRRRRGWRRALLVLVVLALAGAAAAAVWQRRDDGDEVSADTTTTTAAPTTVAPGQTTAPPPAPIDPAEALTPNGVGPLAVGTLIRDLQAAGLTIEVDRPTFDGSGGTCFDGRVQGVGDLNLRFRSPDPATGIGDPADGVLATSGVSTRAGSTRTTETGIALGAPEDQVRAAYPEGLEELPHPFVPGGRILTIGMADDSGNGLAFLTDGRVVTGIEAGAQDVVAIPEGCG